MLNLLDLAASDLYGLVTAKKKQTTAIGDPVRTGSRPEAITSLPPALEAGVKVGLGKGCYAWRVGL